VKKILRELNEVAKSVAQEEGVDFVGVRLGAKHYRLTFRVNGRETTSTAAATPGILEHSLNFARQQARRAIRLEKARR
jgi:hypothetical protein